MFQQAVKGGYAIPAYNFNNMEQLQAIMLACCEKGKESPVILQVSKGARDYANQTLLQYMAKGAVEYAKELTGGKGFPHDSFFNVRLVFISFSLQAFPSLFTWTTATPMNSVWYITLSFFYA